MMIRALLCLSSTVMLASQAEAADAYKASRGGMSPRFRLFSFGIVAVIVLLTVFLLSTNKMPTFPITKSDSAAAAAAQVQVAPADSSAAKSYIVTFTKGKETPEKFVKAAIDKFTQLGGKVTHEFGSLLTGFTVTLPASLDSEVMTFATDAKTLEFPFTIEEDQTVNIADSAGN
ncbi:uncharacterized protein V2V93DRAFT_380654 [Kockiozyma suomiensis]|uniref:uncharacterized protein n=1 Tax=Kockiozyma suomiensis TaxID=1337062 RepID=UPI003343FC29